MSQFNSKGNLEALLEIVQKEAANMAASPVSEEELARSKNQLKSTLFMQLESRGLLQEDQARQLLFFGKNYNGEEMAAKTDAVTAKDVQAVAAKMLKTKPSIAAVGDLSYLPNF
jgi:processing peptidase subunit alpha